MISKNRNKYTAVWLFAAVVAMFGFGYALVPLYYVLCDITGFGGKTNSVAIERGAVAGEVDQQRTVTVEFVASLSSDLAWQFKPAVFKMDVNPGEFYQTSFVATNQTQRAQVGQAVPSVAPPVASLHFQKIECFCFEQQLFEAGESKDMPVVFRVDPELPEGVEVVTLSYTFFLVPDSDS